MSTWDRADVREAFALQLARRDAALAAGAEPLGWKLGFGTVEALTRLGIDEPLVGYLLLDDQLTSGATVAVGGWGDPRIETEIAVHVVEDIAAQASREVCERAIGGLGLAFELVDLSESHASAPELLAGNVCQRAVVLGEQMAGLHRPPPVTMSVNGKVRIAADQSVAVDDLAEVISHVADVLGDLGAGLKAGAIVIAGAIAPPAPMRPGEEYVARAPGLGQIRVVATA